MKKNYPALGRIAIGLVVAIGLMTTAATAEAGKGNDGWRKHHGHWKNGPYVYYDAYAPPPAYVVVPPPQPVYVQPAPVYVRPQPVYYEQRYERPSLNFVFPIRID